MYSKEDKYMEIDLSEFIKPHQIDLIKLHLKRRMQAKSEKSGLGVVYDITYWCNLRCIGCAVNARRFNDVGYISPSLLETQTAEAITVLNKIRAYLDDHEGMQFFLNFGGGEPFIREDFPKILEEASLLFGRKSIGVDTNGTIITKEQIEHIAPFVNYIGVSLDGLEDYHNWWRVSGMVDCPANIFEKTLTTIRSILDIPEASKSLEVSTVATKRNLSQIPLLMRSLHEIGVKHYSIHRAMNVGRFFHKPELLPSAEDYLKLLATVVEINSELGIDVHLHHSIESIYATLVLGLDTYAKNKLGNPDKRSSIGVDPKGNVYFDPWCMVRPWNSLAGGSLLDESTSLEAIFNTGILAMAKQYCQPAVRCLGCPYKCSGGSRIAAASSFIEKFKGSRIENVTVTDILNGMLQIDPACPLSLKKHQ